MSKATCTFTSINGRGIIPATKSTASFAFHIHFRSISGIFGLSFAALFLHPSAPKLHFARFCFISNTYDTPSQMLPSICSTLVSIKPCVLIIGLHGKHRLSCFFGVAWLHGSLVLSHSMAATLVEDSRVVEGLRYDQVGLQRHS